MVLAPTGRDGPTAVGLLQHSGLSGRLCLEMNELQRELAAGAGAAIIAEEALSARIRRGCSRG